MAIIQYGDGHAEQQQNDNIVNETQNAGRFHGWKQFEFCEVGADNQVGYIRDDDDFDNAFQAFDDFFHINKFGQGGKMFSLFQSGSSFLGA